MAFACDSSGVMTILAGKNDESVVKIISSEDHPICYEEVDGETVDPFKIDADTLEGKSVQDIVDLVPSPDLSGYAKSAEVESLKTSVSEGKKLVAAAVTDKGVKTAADSTFQVIANNINSLDVKNSVEKSILSGISSTVSSADLTLAKYSTSATTLYYQYGSEVRTLSFEIRVTTGSSADGYNLINAQFSGNYLGQETITRVVMTSIDVTTGDMVLNVSGNASRPGYISNTTISHYRSSDGIHIKYGATLSTITDSRTSYVLYADSECTIPNPSITVDCLLTGTLTFNVSTSSTISVDLKS